MVGMTSKCLHGRELADATFPRCLKASLLFSCHLFFFLLSRLGNMFIVKTVN
jgi:hypothetical protein